MTGQYAILSEFYDRLMEDTDYGAWVSFYPRCFEKYGTAPGKILEIILPSLIQRTGIIKKCAFAV